MVVEVIGPAVLRRIGGGSRRDLAAEAELVDAALAAVGACQEEGHCSCIRA